MSDQAEIIICGAGPVGLTLAIGLARRGVRSIVLEKKPALSEHSKAIVVLPRSLEIFREYGLEQVFREHSQWTTVLEPQNLQGKPIVHLDLSTLDSISPTAAAAILPQDKTEHLLKEEADKTGLVDIRLGHELVAFNQIDGGGVRVRVRAGEDSYPIEAKFLCACDGAHSTVREDLGLSLEGKTYPAHAVLADVRLDEEKDKLTWPRVDLSKPGFCFFVRFSDQRWRLVVAAPGAKKGEEPTDEYVAEQVRKFTGEGPIEILWKSNFSIHLRNAPHFRVGRILLLGDAAHLNSPAGGQGMNGGIQDAHNLAWKLAAVLKGADEERFLGSYDQERQDAIRHGIDVATERLTKYGILGSPTLRGFALSIVKLFIRFSAIQQRVVKSLGMLNHRYDPSGLIDDSGGQLLPDIKLQDSTRLRDAVGKEGGVIQRKNRQLLANGRSFELMRDLKIQGKFLVVRPDFVVAYAGNRKGDAERAAAAMILKV